MPIGLQRKKRSSFLPNTSPEKMNQDSEVGTTAPTSNVTAPVPYPLLSIMIPSKKLVVTDLIKKGRAIWFPMTKRASGGGILSVKYLNEWQLEGKRGGVRSSSKKRGYNGYRGREVTFTVVLDDTFDTKFPHSTADTIDLLTAWATMETTHAMVRGVMAAVRVKFKESTSMPERSKIALDAMSLLSGNTPEAFTKKHGKNVTFEQKTTGRSTPELTKLDTPLPSLPLLFEFGSMIVAPCIIKKMDIKVLRYMENRITSAEIKIVLQEMVGSGTWAVRAAPKKYIVDVTIESPAPKPRQKEVGRTYPGLPEGLIPYYEEYAAR